MEDEKLTIEKETPEEETAEETAEEKPKKTKKEKVTVTQKDILFALAEAGGEAKSGQLRSHLVEKYPEVNSPALGTAIRKKAIEMASKGKIEAIHVDGKRNYTFKSKA